MKRNGLLIAGVVCLLIGLTAAPSAKAIPMEWLTFNGYSVVEYERQIESADKGGGDPNGSFDADLLDLVFNAKPDDRVRVSADITWEHGTATEEDYGNVAVEFGFAEYTVDDWLKLRAGKFLNPFGYYNEIHNATPAYIPVKIAYSASRPDKYFDDAFSFFPRWGAGISARGDGVVGGLDVDYDLLLANGYQESTNPYEEDDNVDKAVTARVRVSLTKNLTVGESFYYDPKYTIVGEETVMDAAGVESTVETSTSQSLLSDGLMAIFRAGGLELLGEVVIGVMDVEGGDSVTQWSAYIQPSYTFNNGLTPYLRLEYVDPNTDASSDFDTISALGVNYALTHSMSLRVEEAYFKGGDNSSLAQYPGNDYNEIRASVAVGF